MHFPLAFIKISIWTCQHFAEMRCNNAIQPCIELCRLRECVWWLNASPPSATGRNATGSTGSDAQKRLRFNSQALACDQGPSTSTLLTLHHTSQLEVQPTSSLQTLRLTARGLKEVLSERVGGCEQRRNDRYKDRQISHYVAVRSFKRSLLKNPIILI